MTQEEAIAAAVKETTTTIFRQLYVVWIASAGTYDVLEGRNVRLHEVGRTPGGSRNAATHLVTQGKVRICEERREQ